MREIVYVDRLNCTKKRLGNGKMLVTCSLSVPRLNLNQPVGQRIKTPVIYQHIGNAVYQVCSCVAVEVGGRATILNEARLWLQEIFERRVYRRTNSGPWFLALMRSRKPVLNLDLQTRRTSGLKEQVLQWRKEILLRQIMFTHGHG